VAYGRGESGQVERCGGWGMMVGDEGSGYALGRGGLAAALRAADGRGPETRLLPLFLELLEIDTPRAIPPWVGRSAKAEVAALARHVVRAAEAGDAVARSVLETEARELALHAVALRHRLAPWSGEVTVVFYGGVLRTAIYAGMVTRALETGEGGFLVRTPVADAVTGALRYARAPADA
ncbi:MAG TPA: BadF/BadG/BcrA/BcrD ATPase family protein, partial [Longimicrobiaceae bacterium]|nr:BadF/BadG/BcrA/BcrD ATPase family protein [Longimicrobiaceae bacterium]